VKSISTLEARRQRAETTLTVTGMAADQGGLSRSLLFLPNNVPAGIEPADPMIDVRSAAYPIFFGERQ
jgi:catalase